MAAYRRVYDSRHRQADCQLRTGISSGIVRSAIEYGLRFLAQADRASVSRAMLSVIPQTGV